jgi:hypothetical protein
MIWNKPNKELIKTEEGTFYIDIGSPIEEQGNLIYPNSLEIGQQVEIDEENSTEDKTIVKIRQNESKPLLGWIFEYQFPDIQEYEKGNNLVQLGIELNGKLYRFQTDDEEIRPGSKVYLKPNGDWTQLNEIDNVDYEAIAISKFMDYGKKYINILILNWQALFEENNLYRDLVNSCFITNTDKEDANYGDLTHIFTTNLSGETQLISYYIKEDGDIMFKYSGADKINSWIIENSNFIVKNNGKLYFDFQDYIG